MRAWTPVKVVTETHPRKDQAGTVYASTPDTATEVEVTFDLPNGAGNRIEVVKVTDLQVLG